LYYFTLPKGACQGLFSKKAKIFQIFRILGK
jgi:hypothetical protein